MLSQSKPPPSKAPNLESDHARERRERVESVLVSNEALRVVYQPVVDIRTGHVVGAEALARFHVEPRRTPDLWFGEAWSVGFGLELELLAIRRGLEGLVNMPADVYVAVNAAPTTLCSDALLEVLRAFPAERVVVELTEHARVDDYEVLTSAITRLRALGARLSVDDAGAGFSSFQHVLCLRPDVIKLDRSLTTKVDENPVRAALASALVTFAGSLGARICAEGIETVGELATLQRLGITFGQGYLLARPAPLPLAAVPSGVWTTRSVERSGAVGFMPSAAVQSADRLEALQRTELMDSGTEQVFDSFTRLATRLLGVPTSLVSLVDEGRQFFKSAIGLPEPWATTRESGLTHSFCQHAVTTRLPLVIDDARVHPLVRDNAAVADMGVIAYMGVPIITSDSQALGALCAIDSTPRAWTFEEIASLQDLARLLAEQIEFRKAQRDRRDGDALFRRIFDQTNAAVVLCGADGRIEHASVRFCELSGFSEHKLCGRLLMSLEHPDDVVAELTLRAELLLGRQPEVRSAKRLLREDGQRFSCTATTSVIRNTLGEARFTISTFDAAEVDSVAHGRGPKVA